MKLSLPSLANLGLGAAMKRAARGDEVAFTRVYRCLHPDVYSFVSRRIQNVADAEDLTARVFERVVDRIATYDPARGNPRAWALTIARNAVIDELRRVGAAPGTDSLGGPGELQAQLADASLLPSRALEQDEAAAAVRSLLADTPAQTREMFTLRFADGLRHKEIASLLGLTEATVKQRMSRLLRALRARHAGIRPEDLPKEDLPKEGMGHAL